MYIFPLICLLADFLMGKIESKVMSKEKYTIQNGGRVKMAGGSIDTYYHCAEPMLTRGLSAATEAADRFKELRQNPSFPLLMAFFPDDPKSIKHRLRGAGLYRHLRMDQGPGGNFTSFQISESGSRLDYVLTNEQGFAIVEYPIQEQFATGQFGALIPLVDQIKTEFMHNNYRKTAELVAQFQVLGSQAGLIFPTGENVGSKTGFFFIRPTETNAQTEFPVTLLPKVQERVKQALTEPESLAEYSRRFILDGYTYQEALARAKQTYKDHGPTAYHGAGLLYFQPDCFVSNDGSIEVEKINMPDVGLFLTQFEAKGNRPLEQVIQTNKRLSIEIEKVLLESFPENHITLMTRDEVLSQSSDTLEVLEIQALCLILKNIGKTVEMSSLSRASNLKKGTQILLLNVSTDAPEYEALVTRVVREDLVCFPDPLLKAHEDKSSTMRRIELTGKKLEKFLDLIKPKDINSSNAENLHSAIFKYLDLAEISEDIIYVSFDGINTPLPVFRYSLHSFFQIYNALEKAVQTKRRIDCLYFSPVPFKRDTAVFQGADGPRLSAFRFMFTKGL